MAVCYTLEIYGAGVGDSAALGMVGGTLKWSTKARPGFLAGVIDAGSIGPVSVACNILEGGELGGPTGGVSIKAKGSQIVGAVGVSISLAGKSFVLSSVVGSSVTPVFTGTITSAFAPDGCTLEITSQPAFTLDNKSIPFVTVTPAMALGNANSSAVGKTISPIYGNTVTYPLIYCEPDAETLPVMTSDAVIADYGNGNVLYAPAYPHVGNAYQELTPNKDFFKGLSMMQVVSAWQQTALTTPVWITLSVNGKHVLFDNAAQANTNQIRTAFMGKTLVGVSGTGKGDFFKITDVAWDTHNTLTTVWLQLDISDIGKVKASAPWVSASNNGNADFRVVQGGTTRGFTDKLRGAYVSGVIDNEKTILSFSAPTNIFLVSGDCDVGDTLLSIDDGAIEQLDNVQISVLYKTPLWQMIALQSTKLDVNSKTFLDENYYPIPSTVYEDTAIFNGINADSAVPRSDGFVDKTYLDTPLTTHNIYPVVGFPSALYAYNTLYVPIDDLVGGMDLSKGYTTALIPKFKWILDGSWYGAGRLKLKIDINVVGEGNLVLGKVSSENLINFDKSVAGSVGLEIIPEDGIVSFTDTVTSYGLTSASLYSTIKSQLDISELLSVDSIRKIRALVVTINGEYTGLNGWVNPSNFVCDKVISAPVLCITKQVPLTGLFIRSTYDTSITSPAMLVKAIAESNGITCDASFQAVDAMQMARMSGVYGGFYAPGAGESVSSVLSSIARMSGVGLWIDAAGVLHITDVQTAPTVAQYAFDGSDILDGSLTLSTSDCGYAASDFSFEVSTDGIAPVSKVALNANAEEFPGESDYHLSDVVFESPTWEIVCGEVRTSHISARLRGPQSASTLLHSYVAGTVWQIEVPSIGRAVARLDAVAIDPACPVSLCGVRLGFIVLEWDNAAVIAVASMRLRSPQPKWKDFVSGDCVTDYAVAAEMYNAARGARVRLGKAVAASTNSTKLSQPVWGPDGAALQRWLLETVRYSTKDKVIARFSCPVTSSLAQLGLLSFVTFAWGKFHASATTGFVIEKTLDPDGSLGFAVAIIGTSTDQPVAYMLQEAGLPVLTEVGEGVALETEPTDTGTKISDFPSQGVDSLIAGGAVLPLALPGISNAKLPLAQLEEHTLAIAKAYTDTHATSKRVFYVAVGLTSFSVVHGMGSDELTVTVIDTADGATVGIALVVTDLSISATGLAPLEAPLKIIAVR